MTPDTPLRILVVEDDPSQASLIETVFSRGGERAEVYLTRSAEEAITHLGGPAPDADLERSPLPDVIVLDIRMEGAGGLGFLEWYAGQDRLRHIPTIVFTAVEDSDLERRCMMLGAREFKVKPWSFTELVPLVHQVVDRTQPKRD